MNLSRKVVFVLALFAALVAPAGAGAATRLTDAGGDSGAAPDITDIDVGNDVVAGPIVVWITMPNRASLSGDDGVVLYLDSDRDPATGDSDGLEYAIEVLPGSVALYRWDGAEFADADAPSLTAAFWKAEKALRISIHPNDVGGTRSFNFLVFAGTGEEADYAPNGPPLWSYALSSSPLRLGVLEFAVSPRTARAGKRLAAALAVGRNDTNEMLEQGKVTCTLRIGTKTVRAANAGFVEGIAVCAWNLPKSAKGQKVSGTISVTYGGATVKKAFSARVR
jgi:hypothetical protein